MTDESATDPSAEGRLVGADRVIAVLTELAGHPLGVTLEDLASRVNSSKPTVHRALATLRRAGLATLVERGLYVLGDEFLRLAFQNLNGRDEHAQIQPLLEELAAEFGETTHYAVLSDADVVYRAKMDPQEGAVRLTSLVGGRNPAYRTAVGKALLSIRLHTLAEVREWLGNAPLEARTPNTLTTAEALFAELELTRARGYAIDDEENELGVNCIAIAVYLHGAPTPAGAISISAVKFRCPLERLVSEFPHVATVIQRHLGANALG